MAILAGSITCAHGEAGLNHGSCIKAHIVLSQQGHPIFTRVPRISPLEVSMNSDAIKSFPKERAI